MKLLMKYVCTKIGQNEKEVDIKSLLKIVSGFMHKISTKPVEKVSDIFLSPNGILETWIDLWMNLTYLKKSSYWKVARESFLGAVETGREESEGEIQVPRGKSPGRASPSSWEGRIEAEAILQRRFPLLGLGRGSFPPKALDSAGGKG